MLMCTSKLAKNPRREVFITVPHIPSFQAHTSLGVGAASVQANRKRSAMAFLQSLLCWIPSRRRKDAGEAEPVNGKRRRRRRERHIHAKAGSLGARRRRRPPPAARRRELRACPPGCNACIVRLCSPFHSI